MSKASKLASAAAVVTMMVIGTLAAVVPGTAALLKSQNPVASSPGGDDYVWCDKGTQGAC